MGLKDIKLKDIFSRSNIYSFATGITAATGMVMIPALIGFLATGTTAPGTAPILYTFAGMGTISTAIMAKFVIEKKSGVEYDVEYNPPAALAAVLAATGLFLAISNGAPKTDRPTVSKPATVQIVKAPDSVAAPSHEFKIA